MRRFAASTLVLFSAFGNPCLAQKAVTTASTPGPYPSIATTPSTSPSTNANPNASATFMLRDGTDVPLQFAQDLNSKTASEGDPIVFTLTDDLKVGDAIVAKAGSKAFGEVTRAEKSGMLGKAGDLNIRLNYLKIGETKVSLRGTKGKEGESGTTGVIILTVLFGPIGLIKHGKDVGIKQGQALHAYVSEDTLIAASAPVVSTVVAAVSVAPPTALTPAAVAPVRVAATPQAASVPSSIPQMASIAVESSVKGADIEVDGQFAGSTPSTVSVAPGPHTIVVKKTGYTDWTRSLNVVGNGVHLSADLSAQPQRATTRTSRKRTLPVRCYPASVCGTGDAGTSTGGAAQ